MSNVLIIGAGPIGTEYAKILQKLGIDFTVVCRSEKTASDFSASTGFTCLHGGIDAIKNISSFSHAIVAVPVEQTGDALRKIITGEVKNMLVEKPGGLDEKDIAASVELNKKYQSKIFVAYNRRYYPSTQKVIELIKQDGGLTSMSFEFTEWAHTIEKLDKPKEALANWLLANSTHVIDLAFFIGGFPEEWSAYKAGKLQWHPNGSVFTGAGRTSQKILFNYCANWSSAGRWGVELCTDQHKFILRPLEKIMVQKRGELTVTEIELPAAPEFKPGFFEQTKAFLEGKRIKLPTLEEQYHNVSQVYSRIIKGS